MKILRNPGVFICVLFFVVGIATLSHYGMHEDAPFHFLRGQYFLERLLGGDGRFDTPNAKSPVLFTPGQRISSYKLNASEELFAPLVPISGFDGGKTVQQEHKETSIQSGKRNSFYKHNAWGANIWDITENQGHPAISDMLMAATNRLFFEVLGIVPDLEAYQLYGIGVVAISLFFLYLFVADAFGTFAAIMATLTLALYPMVFAETHINIKDPVQMGFYTMAVVSGYFTVTRKLSVDWFVLFIGFVFLALGTKWNIVFLPLILVPWIILVGWNLPWRRLALYAVLACSVPLVLLVFLYPFYWTQTVFKLLNTFDFYASLGLKDLSIQQASFAPLPGGFDARAILQFLSMTPPIMLLFGGIGVIGIIGKRISAKNKAGLLVILWFFVPLLRVIWQTSEFYGSMRHFMEFLPAFAILVGVGTAFIVRKRAFQIGCIVIFVIIQGATLVRWHPYEHIYFNRFFGGLAGAQARGLYTWETLFDAPYKHMALWMNANAQHGAKLSYLDGTMLALSPIWLRDDIRFGSYFSGLDGAGEYIASMVFPKPPAVFPINYLEAFVKPVYEVKVSGVVVAKIWKNDAAHTTMGNVHTIGKNELVVKPLIAQNTRQEDILLPKNLRILTATVDTPDIRCITVRNVVWGVVKDIEVTYMVPWITQVSDTRAIVAFPGVAGRGIRWWDREKSGCTTLRILDISGVE